jgi:transposase
VTYAGIKQRWLIVESAERKQSDIQKLNSKIEQKKKTVLKLGKKLGTTGFDTVTQDQNHLKSINKKLKLWDEQIFRNQAVCYFDLSFIAVFILVDHSRDVACNVPTRFWL